MKEYSNSYTKKIYTELQSLVGSIVAHAIIKKMAEKIGKDEDSLSIQDRSEIVKVLERSISVFLGSEAASNVAAKIGQIR